MRRSEQGHTFILLTRSEIMHIVKVGNYEVGAGRPMLLLAGPCVLEGYERSLAIGKAV